MRFTLTAQGGLSMSILPKSWRRYSASHDTCSAWLWYSVPETRLAVLSDVLFGTLPGARDRGSASGGKQPPQYELLASAYA